jgi:TetR/AcrR family tetracycline transcriptional repressor
VSSEGGLSRARLVAAALELVQHEGLEALSMRSLADRLAVKAASLYWHVRDRRELLELLAEAILDRVPAAGQGGWRAAVVDTAAAVHSTVAAQRDGERIVLEVPGALRRAESYARVKGRLQDAGLQPSEAAEVALVVMLYAIGQAPDDDEPELLESSAVASIAVDSGSRGVVLQRGDDMVTLIRVPSGPTAAAPAIVRGETVKVRRLRGVGRAHIDLNPSRPWRFQIQGPTWNTILDVGGLDVREIKLDSGAARVECFLPRATGVVPIIVSGGVVGVTLHRPPGVAVIADVSTGAVRVKLDDFSIKAATSDLHWESAGASALSNRYELRVSSGAVQVSLDENAIEAQARRAELPPLMVGPVASALDILLDGVEARVRSPRFPAAR